MYNRNILLFSILVLLVALSYIGGCNHGRKTKVCPMLNSDTITVFDTISHFIVDTFPYYIQGKDSIIYDTDTILAKVDTALILKNYFAVHKFERKWEDSLVVVNLTDFISQNKPVHNIFNYKILRPQQIINNSVDNSINYKKYITFGLDIPLKNLNYLELESNYVWQRGSIGIGWTPELKSLNVKAGVTLIKFK